MKNINEIAACVATETKGRRAHVDKNAGLWDAAVLLPLVNTKEGPSLLFQVRSANLGWQPGDVCFPGGKYECRDERFSQTAVRETCEELGLTEDKITLCGNLDYIVTQMGPIVHPYVGILAIKDLQELTCNQDEVAELFTVPLEHFINNPPREAYMELQGRPGENFPFDLMPGFPKDWHKRKGYAVYFYEYKGHVIWGLTARILRGFLMRFGKDLV